MDVLANLNVDNFKGLIWLLAVAIGVVVFVLSERDYLRETIIAVVKGVVSTILSLIAASTAAVFYILSHATDARWSVGRDATIQSPRLPGNPLFGQIINTINSFMGSVTGNVNDLFAIKNAFLSTQDFFAMAGWSMVALLPLLLVLRILNWRQEVWRKNQARKDSARLTRVDTELQDVRKRLGLSVDQE